MLAYAAGTYFLYPLVNYFKGMNELRFTAKESKQRKLPAAFLDDPLRRRSAKIVKLVATRLQTTTIFTLHLSAGAPVCEINAGNLLTPECVAILDQKHPAIGNISVIAYKTIKAW
jgi:hypothetical protein